MSENPRVGAFAIVPSNNLPAAIPFWERLGFARSGGDSNYKTADSPYELRISATPGRVADAGACVGPVK
jgi:hypothetical protein